ncbi:MAG: rod shape-determining protein MreC [Verrucomicrobiales bacterium]|nr:rod shape-determining protein MreC [Verrucomicrobiales bacterium]
MFKRPHYIALVAVILLVLILFRLPAETVSRFKLAVGGFFLPLFGLAGSTQQLVAKTGNAIVPRGDLVRQNEVLRRENQQLKILAQQSQEASRENAQLRQLIGWQKTVPWKLKLAHVIAHDPANWWRTVQIDAGTRDGVQVNFPVLTVEGLVGRVSSVSSTRSQVILLGDAQLRVGAVISDTGTSAHGRETGVVTANASAPLENNMVTLSYLSGTSSVKPGQTVTTSGEGGVFPRGIPIGKIFDLRKVDYGLSTEARVALFASMNSIEEVWVMFPENNAAVSGTPSSAIKK